MIPAVVILGMLLVAEGVFFAELPLSFVACAYLLVLLVPERKHRVSALVLLGIYECLISRVPILAAISLLIVIEVVLELLEGDFNLFSPVVAVLGLPMIELVRHFWIAIFVSLYQLPAPPSIQIAQLFLSALVGGLMFFLLQLLGWNTEKMEPASSW